jgi:hypothetical protein
MKQNPTSWGGNILFDKVDGKFHLYASAMANGGGMSRDY